MSCWPIVISSSREVSSRQAMTNSGFPSFSPQTRRVRLLAETAFMVDDPRPVEFGHPVDDPRAADPFGARERNVRPPALLADDLEGDVPGHGIDPDPLDRPRGRPHPEADMGPLQGGTGGAGGRKEPLAVPQDHLPIRSHIDDQHHLLLVVRLLGDQDGDIIRPDEPRLDGQDMAVGAGMDRQRKVPRLDIEGAEDGRDEGGDPQRPGVDSQQDMVHGRVADERQFEDRVGGDAALGGDAADEAVQTLDQCPLERFQAVGRVVHDIGDPRHDILAVGDLRVHQRVRGDETPRRKIAQIGGQRGRTHIDGQAVDLIHLLREHGEDFLFHPEDCRDPPVSLTKGAGEFLEGGSVDGRAGKVIALREGGDETVEVSAGVLQIWGGQCHREETYSGIQGDDPIRRLFSDHLPARAALLRHEDLHIVLDRGSAGQAESLRLFPGTDQPGLFRCEWREGIGRRYAAGDVRGNRTDPDPTPSTGLLSAAEGFDTYA